MMQTVRVSETSVYFNKTTQRYSYPRRLPSPYFPPRELEISRKCSHIFNMCFGFNHVMQQSMSEMVCGPTFTDHSNSIGRVFFETLIFNRMIKNIP
jgi:hypothetical protein